MARPTVGATTERIYGQLPEVYRNEDAKLDYPLLRYLSLVGDQMSEVEEILDRWQAGELTDAMVADEDWLPWLAQLVGVELSPSLTLAEKRDAVFYASSGWLAASKTAVANAAKTALTGTKNVSVYDHSIVNPGDGGEWDVLLVTRISETPDVPAVLAAVIAKGAKPAGVLLHHRAFESSWDTVAAAAPTWNDWATRTWTQLAEIGL